MQLLFLHIKSCHFVGHVLAQRCLGPPAGSQLVGMLMQVELDQQIPPALYLAVAELLAWLYRLEHADKTAIPPFTKI